MRKTCTIIYVFSKILENEDGQSDEDFFKNRVELMSLQRELVTGRFVYFFNTISLRKETTVRMTRL